MPVDVNRGSGHDVPNGVFGEMIPVDERPPYSIHELLPSTETRE